MTTYTRKAFTGFVWAFAGAVVANLFAYLLRLLLARQLSVAEYGLIYAVLAMFGLVSLFQGMGFADAIATFAARFAVRKDLGKLKELLAWSATILAFTNLLLAIAAFVSADWLASHYFHSPIASLLIRIFAVAVLFSPATVILPNFFVGLQRLDLSALFETTRAGLLFIFTWFLLFQGYGIASAMLAYPLTFFILYLLFTWFAFRAVPGMFSAKTSRADMPKALLAFGFPVMITGVAGLILNYTDTALLTIFSNLDQVGLYQAALPTANLVLFFIVPIRTVLLPMVSELWEREEVPLIGLAIHDISHYALILMVPAIAGIVVFPTIIMNLLFGAGYVAAASTLQVLAIASVFTTLTAVYGAALSGIGKPQALAKATFAGAILNFFLNLWVIPRYGAVGAAISTLFSAALIFIGSAAILRKHVQIKSPWSGWMRTLLSGAAFLAVLLLVRTFFPLGTFTRIGLGILLGGVAYGGMLFLTRAISLAELNDLKRRIVRGR